jgi:uncharacterized protein (TIGR00251 family)
MDDQKPFRRTGNGLRLSVRVTPGASRTEVAGLKADAQGRTALSVRLAAPPVDGAANKALIAFLAKALGVRKADITIRSGETSRSKTLDVAGEPGDLVAHLKGLLGAH